MGNIPYIAAIVASVVAGIIMWWAFGRYQSRLKRSLSSVAAVLLSFALYFVSEFVSLAMSPPGMVQERGLEFSQGFKALTTLLLVAIVAVSAIRIGSPKGAGPDF
jgi:hypothetical protein